MEKNIKIINACDTNCPVKKSLDILSGKWTMMILYQINTRTIRYGELKRAVVSISEKMLIQELNSLVEHKLVTKKAYPEIPPRVEYTLTELGLKTLPIIDQIAAFGLENLV